MRLLSFAWLAALVACSGDTRRAPPQPRVGAPTAAPADSGTAPPAQSAVNRGPEPPTGTPWEVAQQHAEREDWKNAERALKAVAVHMADAPVGRWARYHALWGRVYARTGRANLADQSYGRAEKLYAPDLGDLELVDAVAEARFHFAGKKRKKLEATTFPVLTCDSDCDVARFVSAKIDTHVRYRLPMLKAAAKAYASVVDLAPPPSSRWQIVALLEEAELWSGLAETARNAPRPKGADEAQFAAAAAPIGDKYDAHARPLYEQCVAAAARLDHHDENAATCATWLEAHP